ncbi:hypothetical protein LguiA_031098 [Lonicera macranthoides]
MMDFPQELVVDILSTLLAKSLCRFKCISKSFGTLISDSQFIKTHLTRRKEHNAILFYGSQIFFSTEFDESFDKKVTLKKLDFLSSMWEIVLDSCNGLVLLADKLYKSLILLNPSTRLCKELPSPSFQRKFSYGAVIYGLGYDSSTDDHKIVKIYREYGIISTPRTKKIGVYSIKSGAWSETTYVQSFNTVNGAFRCVFVNGSVHWLAKGGNGSLVIAAFDLAVEKFNYVQPPTALDYRNDTDYKLAVIGGCLCVFDHLSSICGQRDVWVMKEYGIFESWAKISTFHPNTFLIRPMCLLSDGNLLMLLMKRIYKYSKKIMGCKWVVINNKGETVREIVLNANYRKFRPKFTYVESLVSPLPREHNHLTEFEHQFGSFS